MAPPVLTSIEPTFGKPGEKTLLKIIGTDFKVAPTPAPDGYIGTETPVTMQVLINNELATNVRVFSDTLLYCNAPQYKGDPNSLNANPGLSVSVILRNLDPTEENTYANRYSYRRSNLARGDSASAYVLRTLILEMRRQIINNIAVHTSVDFDSTSDTLEIVETAQAPGIAMFGPDAVEDTFRRQGGYETEQDIPGGTYLKTRQPRFENWTFTINMFARNTSEFMNLRNEVVLFFENNKYLNVQKDTSDINEGFVELPLWLRSGPSRIATRNDAALIQANASFELQGVPIDEDALRQVEWGRTVDTTELDMEKKS